MTSYFAPMRATNHAPLALDMQSLFLSGRVLPFGAKLSVTHVFRSSEKSPVEVVYSFPLPRDASLVSFQMSGDGFAISSRLERTEDAQAHYEQALERGSLAAVTQQNVDGLVNLTVGNIRPGETVSVRLELIAGVSLSDNGLRLRFPFTVAPCYHAQMRVSLGQGGVGTLELPAQVAAGVFLPPLHADGSNLHKIGFELQVEPSDAINEIASPSHAIRVLLGNRAAIGVKLSPDRDFPNRDLVLDVKCDFKEGRAWSHKGFGDRTHFALVAPSTVFGQRTRTARRIVFLLDRSGSMAVSPLKQARHAIENCLANLSPDDYFGIVAFDNQVERFRQTMLSATPENVAEACSFLNGIASRGGTELASGVEAAAQLLAGSKGEIFVITDGQVFETSEILQRAQRCEVRLFCLGIGNASQDRFLALLARLTGGICRFVTPSERVDVGAFEVFAAIGGAVATEVHIRNANVQPEVPGTVFACSPFTAFGDVNRGAEAIEIEWSQGSRRVPFHVLGEEWDVDFIQKLQGAKLIANLEAGYDRTDAAARQHLFEMSQHYGLSSSEMSLVAVVERAGDESGNIPKTKIVPVGLAQDEPSNEIRRTCLISAVPGRPTTAISDESGRSSIAGFSSFLESARRPATQCNLLPLVRETIRIVEHYALVKPQSSLTSGYTSTLSSLLKSAREQVADKTHKRALKSLIDYLASNRNPVKWIALRHQLETIWPELKTTRPVPAAQAGNNEPIKAGMPREQALQAFEQSVNQPGTMFSTDHWLQPKLAQLRALLTDPITDDQSSALIDVLRERHSMGDLMDWLQCPPMPWQSFFELRVFVHSKPHPAAPKSIQSASGWK